MNLAINRSLLIGVLSVAFLFAGATASEAQCYLVVSAYSDGAVTGYQANGNADLAGWGSFEDNSTCETSEHEYYPYMSVTRASDGQELTEIYGYSVSIEVTAETHYVDLVLLVYCPYLSGVGEATSRTVVVIEPQPPIILGPASALISMRSFIRDEVVPSLVDGDTFFWGDYRDFCAWCGTNRLGLSIEVNNPLMTSDIFPSPGLIIQTSQTASFDVYTSLDGAGHITSEAYNDWVPDWPMKLNWATSDGAPSGCGGEQHGANTVQVRCAGSASDPLIAFAPPLDFQFTINLAFYSYGIEYSITGCHDSFPDYEIWINDQPVLTDVATGTIVFGLFPVCGVEIPEHSGTVS